MSIYRAEPIRAYASRLSASAESMTSRLALMGLLSGGLVGFLSQGQFDTEARIISGIFAVVCALLAGWFGSRWASKLRFEAEQAKCMLQVEENTAQLLRIMSEREDLQFVVKLEAAAVQSRNGQVKSRSNVVTAVGSST